MRNDFWLITLFRKRAIHRVVDIMAVFNCLSIDTYFILKYLLIPKSKYLAPVAMSFKNENKAKKIKIYHRNLYYNSSKCYMYP